MRDILIGQSYFLRFDPKLWQSNQPYPPLGSLYAASYLRSRGYSVRFFDAMLSGGIGEWEEALDRWDPEVAVLFEDSFNYLSKMCLLRMREAAFQMIRAAQRKGATVIVAGSDPTDNWDAYLDSGADFAILGEGEVTLGDLLDHLSDARSFPAPSSIEGLVSRIHRERSKPRRPIRDLDTLPFPAWDLVDLSRYRRIWKRKHGYFSLNMVTARGCPYHCNWCAKPIWGQRYAIRSPESVVAEMKLLRERYPIDHIWFMDDIFGLGKGWVEHFADLANEAGVVTPFKCLLRTDLVTESAARALARAGCRTVWLGAESGSQKVLDAMEKGASVSDTERASALLRSHGMEVAYFLQFGYPDEDWHDIQKTLQLVWKWLPDDIGISVSYPLPGTPFYERVRERLGSKRNWVDSGDLALLFQGRYPAEFYRRLHRTVHREYRFRRALSRLKNGRLKELRHLPKGLLLPLEYHRLARLRGSS